VLEISDDWVSDSLNEKPSAGSSEIPNIFDAFKRTIHYCFPSTHTTKELMNI
jgi:hypothetical protein